MILTSRPYGYAAGHPHARDALRTRHRETGLLTENLERRDALVGSTRKPATESASYARAIQKAIDDPQSAARSSRTEPVDGVDQITSNRHHEMESDVRHPF